MWPIHWRQTERYSLYSQTEWLTWPKQSKCLFHLLGKITNSAWHLSAVDIRVLVRIQTCTQFYCRTDNYLTANLLHISRQNLFFSLANQKKLLIASRLLATFFEIFFRVPLISLQNKTRQMDRFNEPKCAFRGHLLMVFLHKTSFFAQNEDGCRVSKEITWSIFQIFARPRKVHFELQFKLRAKNRSKTTRFGLAKKSLFLASYSDH